MTDRDVQIGAQVRRHRKIRRVSQHDLATAVGLTRSSIANIEAGRQSLTLGTFLAITKFLGVDDSDLLPPKEVVAQRFPGMSWYEAP